MSHVGCLLALVLALGARATPFAELRVVDADSGRGVPLVVLETVNGLAFVTDNAGRIAFLEPGLMETEVHFTVRGHGYERAKDGFGFRGVRIVPRPGRAVVVEVTRTNVAERLCRLTGEGTFRDSQLLGYAVPAAVGNGGKVAGQDTVQAVPYRGKVYCFWGDTLRMNYPLGLYRMAGATLPIPDPNDVSGDPAAGLAYDYFVDPKTKFARAMMPLPERPEGVIWVESVFTVNDERGVEKLVGHYSRRKNLAVELEQGIAAFNDAAAIFEPVKSLPLHERRRPTGVPIRYEADGRTWMLFGSPNPNLRVPATLAAVLDPTKYEALTLVDGERRWQTERPPTDSETEARLVNEGKLKPDDAHFLPADAANPTDLIRLHRGSVRWNAYRKKWVLIAVQFGGKSSHLGEVWYAEAAAPTGPFRTAVKIAGHDRMTFYNPVHHPWLDRDGGRTIHFEGTYTNDFSGNPEKTPRYNYNQMLYRLDLEAPALKPAQQGK